MPKPAAPEWTCWRRRRRFRFTDPSLQAEPGITATGHVAIVRRDLGGCIGPLLLGPVEAATPRLKVRRV